MVILFSNRKNKTEKDVIEILTACGADFVSDKTVSASGGYFTVAACYKVINLKIKKGIAVIIDDTEKYDKQYLPMSVTGICEDGNLKALEIFEHNSIPVITCGNNHKNTLTISSINGKNIVVTLQRTVTDIYGKKMYPADFKIKLKKNYLKEAILLSVAILLLCGTEPKEF